MPPSQDTPVVCWHFRIITHCWQGQSLQNLICTNIFRIITTAAGEAKPTKFYHGADNAKCSKKLHELNNFELSPMLLAMPNAPEKLHELNINKLSLCYWQCQMLHHFMTKFFKELYSYCKQYKISYFFYLLNHLMNWLPPLKKTISCNRAIHDDTPWVENNSMMWTLHSCRLLTNTVECRWCKSSCLHLFYTHVTWCDKYFNWSAGQWWYHILFLLRKFLIFCVHDTHFFHHPWWQNNP